MDKAEQTRQEITDAGYRCIARWGVSRSTMSDLAREAGMSRATLYRYFPGGREALINQVIKDAVARFFEKLYDEVGESSSLEEVLERGLLSAHKAIENHDVLQSVLRNEPEALHPAMDEAVALVQEQMVAFLVPFLESYGVASGVTIPEAADFLARMLLSHMASPGRWDLADPREVARLVRGELLAGVRA
ncbi:MAG: TetR/AcrR family transcriptional regulator [Actinobacteria bacterium]|nr:TetR/AcrR family transcriptional regulator [Actinomycetota bacterium]